MLVQLLFSFNESYLNIMLSQLAHFDIHPFFFLECNTQFHNIIQHNAIKAAVGLDVTSHRAPHLPSLTLAPLRPHWDWG